ncbi:hypothetical protein EV702DRAFT_648242 [Suillus placidus]|uniref:Uncharacterized protein n=1 Tax=Suillus placidus TaxID=48579 RepID=A0A9P7D6V2_9AGAM|nr:hypothetical protein EV702DRAFT_648242 [Suillus placidus]
MLPVLVSATALNRCWPMLICIGIWSSALCVLNHYTHGKLSVPPTLITLFGTVLGVVLSFVTTSSFERYNNFRTLWSQIVLNCRTFGRIVWLHVPENAISAPINDRPLSHEETERDKARTLIEKKTMVNLVEAYAVSVKHYLRGEDGIYYEDLYPLVSFLPPYTRPVIIPPTTLPGLDRRPMHESTSCSHSSHDAPVSCEITQVPVSPSHLSHPNQTPLSTIPKATFQSANRNMTSAEGRAITDANELFYNDGLLLPAMMPPRHHWRNVFPFSIFFWILEKCAGGAVGENYALRRFRHRSDKHNIPLEISMLLSSYISALQARKTVDTMTINLLHTSLNQLVDAQTGLERVLTTPKPVSCVNIRPFPPMCMSPHSLLSFSSHVWMVTLFYCLSLPFQLWSVFEWFTIPVSVLATFVFFGFFVIGDAIENPFGYDKDDLNLDHFVQNILRKELRALTSTPTPNLAEWVFSPTNNFLGASPGDIGPIESPSAWLHKGKTEIINALHGVL